MSSAPQARSRLGPIGTRRAETPAAKPLSTYHVLEVLALLFTPGSCLKSSLPRVCFSSSLDFVGLAIYILVHHQLKVDPVFAAAPHLTQASDHHVSHIEADFCVDLGKIYPLLPFQ